MESPYLTVSEVAAYLRVNPETVRRWCADGSLRAIRAGRGYRIERAALTAFTGSAVPR